MKEKVSIAYKFLILIVCGLGLYMNLSISKSIESVFYFTIFSNIICFVFYLVYIILYLTKKLKRNNIYYIFKGMVTICITLTLVVFNVLLANQEMFQVHLLATGIAHIYTPILIILDYVIFGQKGNLKITYPFIWSTVLIFYTIACGIYSLLGGTFMGSKYPYFYMDIERYGIIGVSVNCILIYVAFILYGFMVCYLDDLSQKMEDNQNKIEGGLKNGK